MTKQCKWVSEEVDIENVLSASNAIKLQFILQLETYCKHCGNMHYRIDS